MRSAGKSSCAVGRRVKSERAERCHRVARRADARLRVWRVPLDTGLRPASPRAESGQVGAAGRDAPRAPAFRHQIFADEPRREAGLALRQNGLPLRADAGLRVRTARRSTWSGGGRRRRRTDVQVARRHRACRPERTHVSSLRRARLCEGRHEYLVEVAGDGARLATKTRVATTDPGSRRRFGRYWRVIRPGSAVVRRGWLLAAKRRAEDGEEAPALASAGYLGSKGGGPS